MRFFKKVDKLGDAQRLFTHLQTFPEMCENCEKEVGKKVRFDPRLPHGSAGAINTAQLNLLLARAAGLAIRPHGQEDDRRDSAGVGLFLLTDLLSSYVDLQFVFS